MSSWPVSECIFKLFESEQICPRTKHLIVERPRAVVDVETNDTDLSHEILLFVTVLSLTSYVTHSFYPYSS